MEGKAMKEGKTGAQAGDQGERAAIAEAAAIAYEECRDLRNDIVRVFGNSAVLALCISRLGELERERGAAFAAARRAGLTIGEAFSLYGSQ
jgi:hypothetical protein